MRARLLVPPILALAAVGAVVLGANLPASQSSVTGSTRGDPTASATAPSTSVAPETTAPAPLTGPHPFQNYPITALKPGEKPPQFAVVSFDGSCKNSFMQSYLDLARQVDGRFTFFLSGLCLVPDQQRFAYRPPHKAVGSSAIGFANPTLVNGRITDWSQAYTEGNEIGTHFLGHFCDKQGVGIWTKADWTSELAQARTFLDHWATINRANPSADQSLKLSFDSTVWHGARTPCLDGRRSQMYPVWAKQGFTYDASNPGSLQWPHRIKGYDMWNLPLQTIKILDWPGKRSQLSMDYNFLYTQNGGKLMAPRATCDRIETSAYASYMAALEAVHGGNRAPFFVGNHFNDWVCGAYGKALTRFVQDAHADYPDVRFVSNEYLVAWLRAQKAAVLKSLQRLPVQSY